MAKIDLSKVAEVLKKTAEISPAALRRVIEELNLAVQPESGEEKLPAVKKQFFCLVSDPEGRLPKHDFVAWVGQLPENESVATVQDRINRAAYDFNASKRGQLMPVKSVGEALECIPARFFREQDVSVKTKTPVLVLTTDNTIPTDAPASAPAE